MKFRLLYIGGLCGDYCSCYMGLSVYMWKELMVFVYEIF